MNDARRSGTVICSRDGWEAGWVPCPPNSPTSTTGGVRALIVPLALGLVLLATGCDSALDRPPVPATGSVTTTTTTETTVSITPVTPDGFLSGPGVTDQSITLGVLVDPDRDRGFSSGVELWRQTVNSTGGLCGRTVQVQQSGTNGVPTDPAQAYDAIGTTALGVITLPPPNEAVALNSRIVADQVPALTPSGTSTQLGPSRPIVVGPTDDILAINSLDYLQQAGRLEAGSTVGVLTDGSAAADNGLLGARWWAGQHDVALEVHTVDPDLDLTDWSGATNVFSLADASGTSELAAATPAEVMVVTTLDGFDPSRWTAAGLAAAAAGRVLVASGPPAYGSDYPAAVAVASRAAALGLSNPGPRLFDGYATGQNWGRLLTQACADRTLTRTAVAAAASTVGPASVDSLFGPTDPAQAVQSGQPTTRVSSMSTANPAAPAGLTPLTWPEGAAGIEDYLP